MHTRSPNSTGTPAFPFADPFGMRLKQGKYLLAMRNMLTPEHPSVNLVDLPTGMSHEIIQCAEPGHGERVVRANLLAGVVRSGQIPLSQVQVGTMGIFNLLLFSLLFDFVFGRGVLEPLLLKSNISYTIITLH
jgi:hypothetical protein